MHEHRTAGAAPTSAPPNPPPSAGNVQGLGVVDALSVDLQRAQLPWLAAAIDDVYASVRSHLSNARARYRGLPERERELRGPCARDIEQEIDRRAYQLRALEMIRGQLPASHDPAAAAGAGDSGHTVVVGPAPLVTELVQRATGERGEGASGCPRQRARRRARWLRPRSGTRVMARSEAHARGRDALTNRDCFDTRLRHDPGARTRLAELRLRPGLQPDSR